MYTQLPSALLVVSNYCRIHHLDSDPIASFPQLISRRSRSVSQPHPVLKLKAGLEYYQGKVLRYNQVIEGMKAVPTKADISSLSRRAKKLNNNVRELLTELTHNTPLRQSFLQNYILRIEDAAREYKLLQEKLESYDSDFSEDITTFQEQAAEMITFFGYFQDNYESFIESIYQSDDDDQRHIDRLDLLELYQAVNKTMCPQQSTKDVDKTVQTIQSLQTKKPLGSSDELDLEIAKDHVKGAGQLLSVIVHACLPRFAEFREGFSGLPTTQTLHNKMEEMDRSDFDSLLGFPQKSKELLLQFALLPLGSKDKNRRSMKVYNTAHHLGELMIRMHFTLVDHSALFNTADRALLTTLEQTIGTIINLLDNNTLNEKKLLALLRKVANKLPEVNNLYTAFFNDYPYFKPRVPVDFVSIGTYMTETLDSLEVELKRDYYLKQSASKSSLQPLEKEHGFGSDTSASKKQKNLLHPRPGTPIPNK